MTNKQQALEELMAWCEKFDIEIASNEYGIVIQIEIASNEYGIVIQTGDQTLFHAGRIVMHSDIQTELNRMKDDE